MFRRLVSSLLLVLLLFSLFYNTVVWVRYELNVDTITELFCINKDKPELQCFGKCYVSGELMDFNLLPETPEPRAGEANYVPALKNFVARSLIDLNFGGKVFFITTPVKYNYCFWESNYPDPPFIPPQASV